MAENSGKPKKLRADPNDYDGGSSSSSMFCIGPTTSLLSIYSASACSRVQTQQAYQWYHRVFLWNI